MARRSFPLQSRLLIASAFVALTGTPVTAAEAAGGTASETLMLAQVIVLVIFGRLLGEIMFRLGQPSIVGQILAGIILGPSVLGGLWPQFQTLLFPTGEQATMINGLSETRVWDRPVRFREPEWQTHARGLGVGGRRW